MNDKTVFDRLKNNLRKDRFLFAIRISVGVIIAILAADALGIDFAPSTGVITLLTIDQTRENTLKRSLLRIGSFFYTYSISWLVLDFFKLETTLGFAVAITCVTLLTFLLRWDLTLSVNCVILIQLFLKRMPFTILLFLNEFGRLIIGLVAANLVNLIFRVKYKDPKEKLQESVSGKLPH